MRESIMAYFGGEKAGGLLIATYGLLTLVAAAVASAPRWELRPFAITLGVLGLVEVAGGLGLYLRTGPQVTQLLELLTTDRARVLAEEGARMARVQSNFVTLERVWVALWVLSALTAITQKHRPAPQGVALALLLHFSAVLAFDLVGERRGAVYVAALTHPPAER